jgi:hypothetical protein
VKEDLSSVPPVAAGSSSAATARRPSNTFLNYCGIGRDHLAFTVDRNPAKQNTLLPGTRIPVLPVQEISRRRPDYVLILPWNLTAEVSQSLANIRDWGGRFVTAIPNLEIF